MIPIIDTHQHLWDLQRLTLPWLADYPDLSRNFLPEDYREAVKDLNVVKSVYVEVDVEPSQLIAEADDVIRLCRQGSRPTAAAIIGGRPADEGFAEYLERFAGVPFVKGVRQVLHVATALARTCLDERFVDGVRLLGRHGKSFDICVRPAELGDAAELIGLCPDTRFVLDHCGNVDVAARNYEPWRRNLERIAGHSNVVCKVSGIVESAPRSSWTAEDLAPIVNHVLDVFGPERVLFASNWPVCNLNGGVRRWVEALRRIVADRPTSLQRNLFHDNAARFYGL
jgi:L-fuconolactonase